jgi:glycosyltransferase involved in cell wall biosynthesis
MNTNLLVSAVIPTYNRTQQTFAAVESVLAQTYPNVEVIVVDDGSVDGSADVVEQFVKQKVSAGHKVIFVRQRNQGASSARNTGIAKASGAYIGFLDSDDIWLPEKIEWQLKAFEEFGTECGACVTDANLVNDSGMDCSSFEQLGRRHQDLIGIDRNAARSLAESFCFWVSSLLARTETLKQIGGFNPAISFVEDRDIFFRLSLITPIAYVNKLLTRTDRTPSPAGSNCRSWDRHDVQFHQQERMFASWLQMAPAVPTDVRRVIQRALGALHSSETNWHLEHSRYAEARKAVAKAVQYKFEPGTVAKFALTWLTPGLARSIAPKTRPIGADGHAS